MLPSLFAEPDDEVGFGKLVGATGIGESAQMAAVIGAVVEDVASDFEQIVLVGVAGVAGVGDAGVEVVGGDEGLPGFGESLLVRECDFGERGGDGVREAVVPGDPVEPKPLGPEDVVEDILRVGGVGPGGEGFVPERVHPVFVVELVGEESGEREERHFSLMMMHGETSGCYNRGHEGTVFCVRWPCRIGLFCCGPVAVAGWWRRFARGGCPWAFGWIEQGEWVYDFD